MPARQKHARTILAAAASCLVIGCSNVQVQREQRNEEAGRLGVGTELLNDPEATASARLAPVGGSGVDGAIRFAQYGAMIAVRVKVTGLPPYRSYGLHVHESRSCSSVAEAGAGPHFNPGNAPHGRPGAGPHHAGDLPNLVADADGNAAYSFDTGALTVGAGPTSVVGRVVVIGSNADDFKTQPDGNAGKPLACGFIRLDGRAFGAPAQ